MNPPNKPPSQPGKIVTVILEDGTKTKGWWDRNLEKWYLVGDLTGNRGYVVKGWEEK